MKKGLCILLSCCILLPLTGCASNGSLYANYRELEQIQVIQTLGFDRTEGQVLLSASTGQGQGDSPPTTLAQTGDSITAAMEKIQDFANKEELFYAHVGYLLFGEEAAREGLGEVFDFIQRSTQLQMSTSLFVVRGSSAKHLVTEASSESYDITEVLRALERDVEFRGEGWVYSYREVAQRLAASGAALLCAVEPRDFSEAVYSGTEGLNAVPAGYGVLKGDALCAFIPLEEARGVSILENHFGVGAILLEVDGCGVTVEIDKGATAFAPIWGEDGVLERLEVSIEVQAALVELSELDVDITSPDFQAGLNAAFSQKLTAWAEAVLTLSQSLDADFLALGEHIRQASPIAFGRIEENWPAIFPQLPITLTVSGTVGRSFDLTNPVNLEGGQ